MAGKRSKQAPQNRATGAGRVSSPVEELLLAALERGDDSMQTGRYLVTFKQDAGVEAGLQALGAQGLRVADARDSEGQAAALEDLGDADAVVFPEIGVALIGGAAAQERGMSAFSEVATDSPIEAIEPEHFVFALRDPAAYLPAPTASGEGDSGEYLRGFIRAAEVIAQDLHGYAPLALGRDDDEEALVLGTTWGLVACKVPMSPRSGAGIKVAVLDSGMDLTHPDFAGRPIVGQTFVGQPVQDLYGHGTHMIGTACGPKAPAGATPRYGIAFRGLIHAAKVLSNSGVGMFAGSLAGINWAIANRCPVILAAFGIPGPVSAAYTAAGRAALDNGCLIMSGAGHNGSAVVAPANSPTVMSVASLEKNLAPSPFSNTGKIDIAAPGRDIFSSITMPRRYTTWSGTSSAAAHVAGCAALWAESSPALRGRNLWRKLLTSARPLPFPTSRVGAGLVQAP